MRNFVFKGKKRPQKPQINIVYSLSSISKKKKEKEIFQKIYNIQNYIFYYDII